MKTYSRIRAGTVVGIAGEGVSIDLLEVGFDGVVSGSGEGSKPGSVSSCSRGDAVQVAINTRKVM